MAERRIDSIATVIRSKYDRWYTARESKQKDWEKFYRTYRCIEDPADKTRTSERSQIKMPATKQAIDSAYDHIMRSVFGIDPFFDIEGRQFQDDIPAEIFKQYLAYLFETENFASKYGLSIKSMLIYGTCVGRVVAGTVRNSKVIMEDMMEPSDFMDDLGNLAVEEVVVGQQAVMEYNDVNRPEFQPLSVFNFFPDPMAEDPDSGEGMIVRAFPSMQSLRQMARQGIISGVDLIKDAKSSKGEQTDLMRRLALTGIQPQVADSQNNPMTLEYWGWLEEKDLKKAGYKEEIEDGGAEVKVIISGNTTLTLGANPFVSRKRPFMRCCYEFIEGEFWGMGICEPTKGPASALDATIRARLDNKAFAVNTMFGINTRRMIAGQNLTCYPGKIWLTNGPIRESIEQFKVDDVTSGTYQEATEYERYIQEGARVSKALGGQPVKRGEMTATESQGLNLAQNVRIIEIVDSLERNLLKPIMRWYYNIILQFLEVPEEIIFTQEQAGVRESMLLAITPDKIAGDFDLIPLGAASMADQQKLARVRDFMQQVGSSPVMQQMVNLELLVKKNYKLTFGSKDLDQIFNVGPQQKMALANMQNMQGQGSPPKMPGQPALPGGGGGGAGQ